MRLPNSTLKVGDKVKIVRIGKRSAHYSFKSRLIGLVGKITRIKDYNYPWLALGLSWKDSEVEDFFSSSILVKRSKD